MSYQGTYNRPPLVLHGRHPPQLDQNICDILNNFLMHPGLLRATVFSLNSLRPIVGRPESAERYNSDGAFLRDFWRAFLKLVIQVPATLRSQADIVYMLKQLEAYRHSEVEHEFWNNLNQLQPCIDEIWREPTSGGTTEKYQRWVNLNSFASRLYGIELIHCGSLGIRALQHAFELTLSEDNKLNECRVEAAAQWLIHTNGYLHAILRHNDSWMQRWATWKASFHYYADWSGSNSTTRSMAGQALWAMNRDEEGLPARR
ncbi:hypothetical protein F5Y11DRAFT_352705 [Daldinia sp. FL1419]|nr:hypothetical protein F5Y11DRAFT_352705 [Daldinia sp. FL1419]